MPVCLYSGAIIYNTVGVTLLTRLWYFPYLRVLLVTHGMLIRIFAEICLKKTIRLENGSVLRVAFDEKTKKFKSAKVLF